MLLIGGSRCTIKLVVATVEPKLSFAMDAKAPAYMPDSSSRCYSARPLRYFPPCCFVANAADDAAQQKFAINFPK